MSPIDLRFLGLDSAIAAYVLPSSEGPVLIESGPHSTFENLKAALAEVNILPEEIGHVFLTHIHLDHAGAAWCFAQLGANIHVHPFGAAHLIDPSKLMDSARRIYQDKMDYLWGDMQAIEADKVIAVEHLQEIKVGDLTLTALHTPGHAKHHIAWKVGSTIFTGDAAGVKIGEGPVVPPCPPPDINLEHWNQSIDLLLEQQVDSLQLTHFGEVKDITNHLAELREILNDWAFWVKAKWESGLSVEEITPLFTDYTTQQLREKGVDDLGVKQYEAANPSWMSVAGLIRYWKKRQA